MIARQDFTSYNIRISLGGNQGQHYKSCAREVVNLWQCSACLEEVYIEVGGRRIP